MLFPPSDAGATASGKAKVDLIAVHGLNPRSKKDADHAWDTWRTPAGDAGRLWLRDDLPTVLPETRIFLYEYNATAVYGKDRDTFIGKANELLEAIRIERDEDEDRPIIFLGHSMGGLLIKQALINGHNNPKYTSIKKATTGLVFFATPHKGGDERLVSLGAAAAKIATWAGFQKGDNVIKVLKEGSMFSDIMDEHWRHQLLKYDIVSFWGAEDDIVPPESARFGLPGDRENVVKLNADHSGVCKFGPGQADQDNFKLVRGNIRDAYRNALKMREFPVVSSVVQDGNDAAEKELQRRLDGAPPHSEGRETHQRHYYIPLPQNRKFTGRSEVLQRLQEKLFEQPDCQKLAVLGLGGVGKTSVALQFAYWVKRNQPDYSVLWISAYSRTGFDQAYGEIARRLGIQANNKEEDSRELVRRHLESEDNGKWFLVVDNVDDEAFLYGQSSSDSDSDAISEAGIHQYLPESENCTLLFTTRSPDVAVEVADPDVVELTEMSSEEALGLLRKSLRRQQLLQGEKSVAKFLEELAYLPLAIAQAAAYLNRNRHLSISSYLELLGKTEQDTIGLLSREFRDESLFQASQRAVATTWLVSFDQICVSDGAAMRLLSFISCIEPKSIPVSLLPQMETAEEREHAIGTLCGYAFLVSREDGETFEMHRLVHLAMRNWNQRHNRVGEATLGAVHQLNAVFPSSDKVNRDRWRAYLPHAVRALRESKEYHVQERYDLFYRVGQCLFEDRRFKEAVEALEETASWRRDQMSDSNPARLESQHELARAYIANRRIREATRVLEWVVAVEEQTLDERDYSRLASQHALASAYLEDRRVEEAIKIFEHVVAVREQMLDERDHDRLWAQHALASAYLENRRIKEAIKIFEHVAAVREQTLDKRDYSRLASQHELASAYLNDRRIKEAIDILECVVEILEQVLDERDHSLLASQHELASAYLEDRRIKEAIVIFEHVVAVEEHTLDERDHDRLWSQHQLATAYLEDRRLNEAIVILEHVVAIREQTLNARDHSRLSSQQSLARVYLDNKRSKEAIVMLEHVVAVFEQTLDERDYDRLTSQHELARAYLADGETQKAVILLEHVVAIKSEILTPDDYSTVYIFQKIC